MFLWFPPPTKTSWHNARESAESCGTIHLEINFSSGVYSKSLLKGLHEPKPLDLQPLAQRLYIWGQYIDREKIKVTKYPRIKISYTGNYLFCKLDSYTK